MSKSFLIRLSALLCSASIVAACLSFLSGNITPSSAAEENGNKKSATTAQSAKGVIKIKKRVKRGRAKLSASQSISLGRKLYNQYQCYDCHSIAGKGCVNGFRLDEVGSKRTRPFIEEHLVDPDKHFDKHPSAFGTDMNLMPPQNLEPWEINSLVDYLYSLK